MSELENSEFRGKKSELLFELFGKMWVHLRRFEVNRISVWLGSNGLMRARPGRKRYFLMAWWSKLLKVLRHVRRVRQVIQVRRVRQVRQVLLDGLVVETRNNKIGETCKTGKSSETS
jgi:hypothetical protein